MASGSHATRSVADIVLTHDSFAALAPAVEEGQRILNGMSSVLSLFLARIATMGLLIVSSMVVGLFPVAVRNSSVITLFSVGIPAVLLAVWAQPGRHRTEGIGTTISHFVIPAAVVTSLVGLLVLYGTLALQRVLGSPAGDGISTPIAQASLTTFLVLAGLALVVFVEPPTDWMAVIRPKTSDRRPTVMAVGLGIVYGALIVIEPVRDIFALERLDWPEVWFVGFATVVWLIVLRLSWRHRVIERLVGTSPRA
jgi:cation-transporting ATPase E